MPTDGYGNTVEDDWVPANPVLRGETRTPDSPPITEGNALPDELPHRVRVAWGLAAQTPDPGYDPDADDLL